MGNTVADKNIAWTMSVDTAMEFWKRCIERKADTEKERIKILAELAEEGRMQNVVATNKTKEEYIQDKAKHFKLLRIDKNEQENS